MGPYPGCGAGRVGTVDRAVTPLVFTRAGGHPVTPHAAVPSGGWGAHAPMRRVVRVSAAQLAASDQLW